MPLICPASWLPVGVDSLEPTAEEVVRSMNNVLVVAGPGAGKTELLAQRACYLLDTGLCPIPKRILAISFKRDAAKNLEERVQRRCRERSTRFDSLTLDAFAKSIVDRFRLALPEEWRPNIGYEIMTRLPNVNYKRDWLENAGVPKGHERINYQNRADGEINRLFDRFSHGYPLPYNVKGTNTLEAYLGLLWWKEQLGRSKNQPSLTFPMINRLAAFLLRRNPKLVKALRATYSFVFLDEFQDTTHAQYDLIRASFIGSNTILTAVGDGKQRIMLWAGAMPDVFDTYESDFAAERHLLLRNYRSAPELVKMQYVIAQILESGTNTITAARVNTKGSCSILEFSNPEEEAEYIAQRIERAIREGKTPRDFCIIVRQRTSEMIETLKNELSLKQIRLRDESQLQDLLVEPVSQFILAILRLGTRERDSEAWDIVTNELALLRNLDQEEDSFEIETECSHLLKYTRNAVGDGRDISEIPLEILKLVGTSAFRSTYRQYRSTSFLKDTVTALADALSTSIETTNSSQEAVDELIGVNVIPAMTIHKSKGLEFHTVIFLGLEDSQWWAFANQPDEERRGFFVAFSRASEQVYFTFSDVRDSRWGRRSQRKNQIGDLYNLLEKAGVPVVNCRKGE